MNPNIIAFQMKALAAVTVFALGFMAAVQWAGGVNACF